MLNCCFLSFVYFREEKKEKHDKERTQKLKKYAMIGVATVGGGALLGLTGGLAAPLIAAGAGAVIGKLWKEVLCKGVATDGRGLCRKRGFVIVVRWISCSSHWCWGLGKSLVSTKENFGQGCVTLKSRAGGYGLYRG